MFFHTQLQTNLLPKSQSRNLRCVTSLHFGDEALLETRVLPAFPTYATAPQQVNACWGDFPGKSPPTKRKILDRAG